jgi:hypothetical protein
VSLLLKAGADIEAKTALGLSPLLCADDAAVAAVLVAANANLKHVDHDGRSACHHAVDHPRVLALLIAAGANPHLRCENGETALHRAAELRESSASMLILINAGVDVNQGDNDGNSPATIASFRGRPYRPPRLHQALYCLHCCADRIARHAPAGVSCCRLDPNAPPSVLDSGVDIGPIDITAAHGADSSALLLLRSLGVNLNGTDEHGNTACHHVRDKWAFAVLFAFGAAATVNHNGETPFMAKIDRWHRNSNLLLAFAAAGHCCGVTVELDSPRNDAIVVAGGGRVSVEADTNRLLTPEARVIDLILQRQEELFCLRAGGRCASVCSRCA